MDLKIEKENRFVYGFSKAIEKYFIQDGRTKQQMKFTEKEIRELIGCFTDLLKPEGEKEE